MAVYRARLLFSSSAGVLSPRLQPYVGWGGRPKVCQPRVAANNMIHLVMSLGRRFLIATTGIINGNTLMDAFGGVGGAVKS
jgi:hypothetical protein